MPQDGSNVIPVVRAMAKVLVENTVVVRKFESCEQSGHRVTFHVGPDDPKTSPEFIADVTLVASPGKLDALAPGKRVRITFEVEE